MDRINKNKFFIFCSFIFILIVFLAIKAVSQGWMQPHEPLPAEVGAEPVLLFFNKNKGCECELIVYRSAETQINTWVQEGQLKLPLYRFDLLKNADLAKQFSIVRAPTLLLLDSEGNIIYRQDEVITDLAPFDLNIFENKILQVIN